MHPVASSKTLGVLSEYAPNGGAAFFFEIAFAEAMRCRFCWRVGYALAPRQGELRERLREVTFNAEVGYAVPTRNSSPTRKVRFKL